MQRDKKAAKAFRYVVAIAAYALLTSAALSTSRSIVGQSHLTIETAPPPVTLAALAPATDVETTGSIDTTSSIDRSTIEPDSPAEPPVQAPRPRFRLSAEEAIVGIASFYDFPQETASGEVYDREAYTAAAQLKLRGRFGGIKFGRLYRPAYGLAEWEGKKIILKFNDVGPLRPGRTVDLSRAAMLYFTELKQGLLHDFKVTPLPLGEAWPVGPVTDPQLAALGIDTGVPVADVLPLPAVPATRAPHPLDEFAFTGRPIAAAAGHVFASAGFWSEASAQLAAAALSEPWDDQLIVTGSVPAPREVVPGIDYWD